jgi:hypothetical protein
MGFGVGRAVCEGTGAGVGVTQSCCSVVSTRLLVTLGDGQIDGCASGVVCAFAADSAATHVPTNATLASKLFMEMPLPRKRLV